MESTDGMSILADSMQAKLAAWESKRRRRSLRPLIGQTKLDLTHNDYLGLRENQAFQERARLSASTWPLGAGASRLLGGEYPIYGELEAQFSRWIGAASALYFSSGFAANEALMVALQNDDVVFFSDEFNHASLIDGLRLARLKPGQKQIFPHNNMLQLGAMMRACPARLKIVVTESLFSMDGDFCPALDLQALCQQHNALLVVDEAHSLGVYGPEGRAWMAAQGIDPQSYIAIYPCGKAMASSGAFVCGPPWLRDYLINSARSFIYSTGPSPWIAAALCESIKTVQNLSQEREHLQLLSQRMRQGLISLGFQIDKQGSHIIPLILGSESKALAAEAFCGQRGLQVRAIRPPTVAEQSSRLRLSLHAGLSFDDCDTILAIFQELFHALSSDICHRDRN